MVKVVISVLIVFLVQDTCWAERGASAEVFLPPKSLMERSESPARIKTYKDKYEFMRSLMERINADKDISDTARSMAGILKGDDTKLGELYELYAEIAEKMSTHAERYLEWVLSSYPPQTGKRYIVICQQGANPLGVMIKAKIRRLGWEHLIVKDIHISTSVTGDRHYEMGIREQFDWVPSGENTDKEILDYLKQEGLTDGRPIAFIDTGTMGSVPWVCQKVIDIDSGKGIQMETKLFFYNCWDGIFQVNSRGEMERVGGHAHPISGFNQTAISGGIDLFEFVMWIEHDFPRRYQRLERMVSFGGRIAPELFRTDPWEEIRALTVEFALIDLVNEESQVFGKDEDIESIIREMHFNMFGGQEPKRDVLPMLTREVVKHGYPKKVIWQALLAFAVYNNGEPPSWMDIKWIADKMHEIYEETRRMTSV